jgi:hypothetical protein
MIAEASREGGRLLCFQSRDRRCTQLGRQLPDGCPATGEGEFDLAAGKATGLPARATVAPDSGIGCSLDGEQQLLLGAVARAQEVSRIDRKLRPRGQQSAVARTRVDQCRPLGNLVACRIVVGSKQPPDRRGCIVG